MSAPLCGAKCRDGHTCTNSPMHGAARCYMHGAASPQARLASKRRLAQAAATKAIERAGIEPVGDPLELMRRYTAKAAAAERYFDERLKALEELRYQAGTGEQTRAEVQLWERAIDRAQRFAHDLAKIGLDTRAVAIDEARIVLLVAVLEKVLASPELALDATRQARGRELLAEALDPQ